jgi:hypothetical protein
MKLLEKGNRITLFEGGIVVDENLLKYKNLEKIQPKK